MPLDGAWHLILLLDLKAVKQVSFLICRIGVVLSENFRLHDKSRLNKDTTFKLLIMIV